jgi:superoxide dismutase, Fe-Mn family
MATFAFSRFYAIFTMLNESSKNKGCLMKNYITQDHLIPKNLKDISDTQVEDHWGLYKGYVKNVNTINQELSDLRKQGEGNSLLYADRRRRYGFEYCGMVLHEYYFGNLKGGQGDLAKGELYSKIEEAFGSYENWKNDFSAAGKTRGIGWAILYFDPATGNLTNHFVAEHQNGDISGFSPVLVMDVWEHAYMVDHRAGGRGKYIDAFLNNINWEIAEKRFDENKKGLIASRF